MYRSYNPFQDHHLAYFDSGKELPDKDFETEAIKLFQDTAHEAPPNGEVIGTIRALYRAVRNQPNEKGEKPRSPVAEAFKKLSPIINIEEKNGEQIVTKENPNGFDPLIEAFNERGLSGMKARIIAEMAPHLKNHSDDKNELSKMIAFSIGQSEDDDTKPNQPPSTDEVTSAVSRFLEHAQQIYGGNQETQHGGSISSARRSLLKNFFSRTQRATPAGISGLAAKTNDFKLAYRHGGDAELKAVFFLHVLPTLSDAKAPEAQGNIAKIIDYQPTTTAPQETQH